MRRVKEESYTFHAITQAPIDRYLAIAFPDVEGRPSMNRGEC